MKRLKNRINNYLENRINNCLEKKMRQVTLEILEEKKFNLKDGLQELAKQETCVWIQDNVPINLVFEDRFALLKESLSYRTLKDGLILEFGVYKGDTINCIAQHVDDTSVYGFDSFEGLQEPWVFSGEGGFSDVNGTLPKVPENVELIKGYFSDTLPNFIEKKSLPVSFLHIDSDLYSSAVTILEYLNHLIVKGTVIVFDEFFNYPNWKKGEYKAWIEFVEKQNIEFEYIGYTYQKSIHKKSANQLAIKIINR